MAKDLQQAFEQASALFNAGKYDELGALFDIDVVMKRVDDPGSIAGIGNLIAYLNTHQKSQNPQFRKVNITSKKGDNGTQGIVRGTAEYVDNQQNKKTINIDFIFVFTRDDTNGDWLLANTFAVPR